MLRGGGAGTDTPAARRTRRRVGWLAAGSVLVLSGAHASAQTPTTGSGIPLDGSTEESLGEVARQVNNPIGPLWQVTFDHAIGGLGGGGLGGVEPSYTGSLEPQFPVALSRLGLGRSSWGRDFTLITRLIVPFVETVPLPAGPGTDRVSGVGDLQLGSVLAPSRLSGWVWALGPTFILPSASDDALGQGKWQAGPAGVAGYQGREWTVYALAQQWWSFAGDGDRPRTSQLSVDYVLLRSLPHRWQVGMQPTLQVDWTASAGNEVSFPVGLGFGKTVRIGSLPLQLWLEADYYPVRPSDRATPRWGIDLQIVPVIPPLF